MPLLIVAVDPVMPFAAGNGVWRLVGAMVLIAIVTLVLDWRARR